MTFSSLFFLVLIVACPLGMWLMMRGGHGMGMGGMHGGESKDTSVQDKRVAGLEAEVARLRGDKVSQAALTPTVVDSEVHDFAGHRH